MKKILFTVLMFVLIFNTMGCRNTANSKNEEKVSIRGQITKLQIDDNKSVIVIMVEGKVESDTEYDKASVGIDKNTKISKGNAGQKISASELKEGLKVEVVFTGPVRESYPVQATAKTIRVLE